MNQFAEWLSTTAPSVFIQDHNSWVIPVIQSIHIVGIAAVLGSAFMIYLRLFGRAYADQSIAQTAARFGPWLTNGLWLMLVTGALMVIGEPVRELVTFSFWAKMILVALATVVAIAFLRSVRRGESSWDETRARSGSVRGLAILTFVIWLCIIILGRLIAYDHVWGPWSPATKA